VDSPAVLQAPPKSIFEKKLLHIPYGWRQPDSILFGFTQNRCGDAAFTYQYVRSNPPQGQCG
jgi:hypothetical protein